MQARKVVVTLLVVLLPWQSFAALAISPASHHHDAAEVGHPASAAATHHLHEHHVADQHHDVTGASPDPDDGSTAESIPCTDICCSPALATIDPAFTATNGHSWVIPFAMHRLPSRAPDRLERPPRSLLV